MYINCKTYFSFRYGTYSSEELVNDAAEKGVTCLALTNINNTCDAWDFVQCCQRKDIKPVIGTEIRNDHQLLYILLAANADGMAWINDFLSTHLQAEIPFPLLPDGPHFFNTPSDGYVIYPLGYKEPAKLLVNEYIGIQPKEITKLFTLQLPGIKNKLVIRQPVTVQNQTWFNVHRLLRAIDKNELLSKLKEEDTCSVTEQFIAPSKLIEAFSHYPFIVTNTYKLIDQCSVDFEFGTDKNKKLFSASLNDDKVLLQKLAMDGLKLRYGNKNKEAKQRVEKELKIINELGFNAYFLITYDIIRYAQNRGYYYVGRGSGANSIVAYCLQITDVDPVELDLYFERFLNPYRSSPPDFDIDFSWLDRDDVIDYIFKRYGKQHVALLGMYSTFKYRAVVRELGKVFGLPKGDIDQLAASNTRQPEDKIQKLILQYGKLIQGFPNHLSIHPGGMLISEKPISNYTALHMPPKGFSTAQIDMFIAEDIGLYKLDILSQRGLGHIKESLRLIQANQHISVNIHEIEKFKKDEKVKKQIREVNTIGCFYIESPAMRQLLKKLECDDYITLVAASSIIRPGVAQSGMMKEYITRYHHPGNFKYLHPKMEELLKETYGVMVFQEDVIKVAHHFAGLDMGESDILRRAMSGKYRGNKEMLRIKEKFFINCKEKKYDEAVSTEVWRQIESFGGYSFSKAHSASFAVESYQSLFLKTYFPLEFMVAVINNFGGFYSTELYFYELRKAGGLVQAPCVNNSDYYTNICGKLVYVGFVHIKSLEEKTGQLILEERFKNGCYINLQDFMERTLCPIEQLNILIKINAFRFTGKNKKQLLWEANFIHKKNKQHTPANKGLFIEKPFEFQLPALSVTPLNDLYDELEILGFPLSNPFDFAADDGTTYTAAKDLALHQGKIITVLGYYIAYKVVPTVKGETMCFGTFLDHDYDWIDTVHFPESFKAYPLNKTGFYKITGKVVEDFGVYNIEVHHLIKIGLKKEIFAGV